MVGRSGPENVIRRLGSYLGGRSVLSCWVRTFLLLFIITFLWVQVTFGNFYWARNSTENLKTNRIIIEKAINIENESQLGQKELRNLNESSIIDLVVDSTYIEIREKIRKYNEDQYIINEEIYKPLSNDSVVIVIQVHNRIIYLRYLIESLSRAKDINQTLLVFSHDVYDEDINMLIQAITFCKVVQIFLPYSVEAHPQEFPGNDPNDCPRDIGKARALKAKCISAEYPDKYGHYRESKFTQMKHHWWWKANHVFNHLAITKAYTGLVTLLEEDHYVAEDFIYLLKIMDRKCSEMNDCYFLGLGFHIQIAQYQVLKDADQIKMSPLISNLGLTFNKTTFNVLLGCSKQFCEYDDYNWDWTLNKIAQTCGKAVLRSMIPAGPRVFHTGECGIHVHKNNCKENAIISKIDELLKNAKTKLFPSVTTLIDTNTIISEIKENGGWGDIRDHELCMNMTKR